MDTKNKNQIEKKAEYELKTGDVARADKAWQDYSHLAPEGRTARKLAELWSQKENAKVALKKFLK